MNKLAVFALLLIAASVNADFTEEKLHDAMQSCADKHGLTMEEVKGGYADTEKGKELSCFHACVMQEIGVMDGAEVNVDTLKEMMLVMSENKDLDKEKADAAVDSCAEEAKDLTDPCEVSLAYGKCLRAKLN